MTDDVARQVEAARIIGAIDERTKNIEKALTAMSESMVTRSEFNVWKAVIGAVASAVLLAFMYALFSGNVHIGH